MVSRPVLGRPAPAAGRRRVLARILAPSAAVRRRVRILALPLAVPRRSVRIAVRR